jgi:serine kinase of HPr protein (carbohydrate metabolism regulator)
VSAAPTIHGTAVLVGAGAVLIRGPSGAGKSMLALQVLQAAAGGMVPFARLVADDRVYLEEVSGALLARPPAALAGLLEVRGVGVLRFPYEPLALVSHIVDLCRSDAPRFPEIREDRTILERVSLPCLTLPAGIPALPAMLAWMGLAGSLGPASPRTEPPATL